MMKKKNFTFLVRIFSAIDVADSSRSRSSMGAIDGPCSPCTLTKTKRTHRHRKRWNKFNATTIIEGFCTSFDSLALTVWPICCCCCCCLVVIFILRNNCANPRLNVVKSRLIKFCSEIIDLRKYFRNFSIAFFACGTFRRIRNDQKWNRDVDNTCFVFDCTLTDVNLLIVRCKIATFSQFHVLFISFSRYSK